jgi:hypothetical protein
MNHSFYSVDRTTHLKIVALALIGAIAVAGFGIAKCSGGSDASTQAEHVRIIKAGQPATIAWNSQLAVR